VAFEGVAGSSNDLRTILCKFSKKNVADLLVKCMLLINQRLPSNLGVSFNNITSTKCFKFGFSYDILKVAGLFPPFG